MKSTVHIISNKCTSCELCVPICPTFAISYGIDQFVIDTDMCTGCEVCADVCPENAIQSIAELERIKAAEKKSRP